MSRLLYQDLEMEDMVLAEPAYGSYVDLALVQQQGADSVLRKHSWLPDRAYFSAIEL